MIDLEEAQRRVLDAVSPLGKERVSLEQAVGRVLADDLFSPVNLPGFDYSAMDGYAIDLASGTSARRAVVSESRAGGQTPPRLVPGTAMRILTGAPIPEGADAIVMQEETTREGDLLTFTGAPKMGDHVRRAGEDLARGTLALGKGTRLRPSHVPLLAALEVVWPAVHRRPVATVLATGDELREPGAVDRPGSIIETNGLAIAAMARAVGAHVRLLPIVRDEREALRKAMIDALDNAEVAITIGGVSVGDHDLVKPILEEIGVVLDFWRVAIKPGKPLAMGRKGSTRVLGLPGNPVSAMLTFVLFGAPLLRALEGEADPLPKRTQACLSREVKHHPGRTEFLRATLSQEGGESVVTPISSQSSGSIVSMAWADALIVIPKDSTGLAKEARVEIIRL